MIIELARKRPGRNCRANNSLDCNLIRLSEIKSTSCVALALLNAQGIYASCEGDMPALYSMAIANLLTDKPAFQANPSSIDFKRNEIIFAHCTLPYNMSKKIKLMTHYESDIGVALKSEINTGAATVFKTDGNRYFVSNAKIVNNLNKNDLCRTQITCQLDHDLHYFTSEPIGNHHIIINGAHADIIKKYCETVLIKP